MPPPDTVYVLGADSQQEAGSRLFDSVYREYKSYYHPEDEQKQQPDLSWLFVFVVVVGLSIIAGLIGSVIKDKLGLFRRSNVPVGNKDLVNMEMHYDKWLQDHNPYYASLSHDLRKRFLTRVIQFIHSKEFHFHSLEPDEKVTVLISGAAVQLTFGLKNFLMDYYPVINVIKKEYVLKMDNETYYGHVSNNGIYISWKHFQEGYEDYSDSVNVGLHEMAHALSFDAYLGYEDMHDRNFKIRLQEFTEDGVPVFRALKKVTSHVLDEYATTNFDEFWAVSVETFFENPELFKHNLPDLYQEICDALNQDPMLPGKIIDPEIAGIWV